MALTIKRTASLLIATFVACQSLSRSDLFDGVAYRQKLVSVVQQWPDIDENDLRVAWHGELKLLDQSPNDEGVLFRTLLFPASVGDDCDSCDILQFAENESKHEALSSVIISRRFHSRDTAVTFAEPLWSAVTGMRMRDQVNMDGLAGADAHFSINAPVPSASSPPLLATLEIDHEGNGYVLHLRLSVHAPASTAELRQ